MMEGIKMLCNNINALGFETSEGLKPFVSAINFSKRSKNKHLTLLSLRDCEPDREPVRASRRGRPGCRQNRTCRVNRAAIAGRA